MNEYFFNSDDDDDDEEDDSLNIGYDDKDQDNVKNSANTNEENEEEDVDDDDSAIKRPISSCSTHSNSTNGINESLMDDEGRNLNLILCFECTSCSGIYAFRVSVMKWEILSQCKFSA